MKENVIIKAQKKEIEEKNIELQETIDELNITKISRKAKMLTMFLGVTLVILEEPIMHVILHNLGTESYFLNLSVKV